MMGITSRTVVWVYFLGGNVCDQYNTMESQSIELELFSEFLEQIDEEVLITDGSGIIIAVNSKIPNVWGGCTEDYVGKDCRTLNNAQLHGDAGQRFIEAVLQSEEKHVELYTEVNSEGKARHYLVRIFPFRNAAGTARRVVMTRLDLTKQAEVQQQLQSSQKKALIGEMMA